MDQIIKLLIFTVSGSINEIRDQAGSIDQSACLLFVKFTKKSRLDFLSFRCKIDALSADHAEDTGITGKVRSRGSICRILGNGDKHTFESTIQKRIARKKRKCLTMRDMAGRLTSS